MPHVNRTATYVVVEADRNDDYLHICMYVYSYTYVESDVKQIEGTFTFLGRLYK